MGSNSWLSLIGIGLLLNSHGAMKMIIYVQHLLAKYKIDIKTNPWICIGFTIQKYIYYNNKATFKCTYAFKQALYLLCTCLGKYTTVNLNYSPRPYTILSKYWLGNIWTQPLVISSIHRVYFLINPCIKSIYHISLSAIFSNVFSWNHVNVCILVQISAKVAHNGTIESNMGYRQVSNIRRTLVGN